MDIETINEKLALGDISLPEMFPHLQQLKDAPYVFKHSFGLDELPTEPGILMIRGARQYGKSTWLEQKLFDTIQKFGRGTGFYLNGENLLGRDELGIAIDALINSFDPNAAVKRIFIDEITAINQWEIALKRLADNGRLKDILVVTTGSKATDLRRGSEKLPGRKGKLKRTTYLFTPLSYPEFHRVCSGALGDQTLIAYMLSGGSPIACAELAVNHTIPEYVIELVRDWIEGEIAAAGRTRTALLNIMNVIVRFGGTAVGQAKVAREAGMSNNSVAQGYLEVLNDLGCIVPAYPWDNDRRILILRKPAKYHMTNLLALCAYHPARVRSLTDFIKLGEVEQGKWYEWLIAQELQRRSAKSGDDILAPQGFWQSKSHELDFVLPHDGFIEVKRGEISPLSFYWFAKQFPKSTLTVLNQNSFTSAQVKGQTIESFLLED